MYNFSFLLPTRKKAPLVYRLFDSIIQTTNDLSNLEIILGIDEDDEESKKINDTRLNIRKIYFPSEKNYTLPALFEECFKVSNGRFVQMMNDDVVLKTKDWDNILLKLASNYPDDICLFHVNDLFKEESLSCHPIVSRRACLKIGFTDIDYNRYAPDDHIYDIYNILSYLGFKRTFFFPGVIFQHLHDTINEKGKLVSIFPDVKNHTRDVKLFMSVAKQKHRQALALKLVSLISPYLYKKNKAIYKSILESVKPYNQTQTIYHTIDNTVGLNKELSVIFITDNLLSAKSKKSLKESKLHCSNYNLFIIERNTGYIEQINHYLKTIKEPYLAIIDENIRLRENWFTDIKKSFDKETALVSPSYRSNGIIYSNFFFIGDDFIDYSYVPQDISVGSERLAVRSSMLVLDMQKLKTLSINNLYMKYYLGVEISLSIWQSGYKVKECYTAIIDYIGDMDYPYNSRDGIVVRDKAVCIARHSTKQDLPFYMQKDYISHIAIEQEFKRIESNQITADELFILLEKAKLIFTNPLLINIKHRIYSTMLNYLNQNEEKDKIYQLLLSNIMSYKSLVAKVVFVTGLFISRKLLKYKIKENINNILLSAYDIVPAGIKSSKIVDKTIRNVISPLVEKLGLSRQY